MFNATIKKLATENVIILQNDCFFLYSSFIFWSLISWLALNHPFLSLPFIQFCAEQWLSFFLNIPVSPFFLPFHQLAKVTKISPRQFKRFWLVLAAFGNLRETGSSFFCNWRKLRRENELFEKSFSSKKQGRKTGGKGELAFVTPLRIINSLLFLYCKTKILELLFSQQNIRQLGRTGQIGRFICKKMKNRRPKWVRIFTLVLENLESRLTKEMKSTILLMKF